jgi:hypothetical protein
MLFFNMVCLTVVLDPGKLCVTVTSPAACSAPGIKLGDVTLTDVGAEDKEEQELSSSVADVHLSFWSARSETQGQF